MTCRNPSQSAILVPLFDRILSRIEAGEIQRAVAHLAGLFDAALINCGEPAAIRAALVNHPLSEALRQPSLAAETARLGPESALAARADLARLSRCAADQHGHSWLDLDRGGWPKAGVRFDLILAADLPDRLGPAGLADAILALAANLSAAGRLVLSAFVPGQLGTGWQTIWLDRVVERHDPAAIASAARAAGLVPRLFHDAGGNLVWAELRRGPTE